MTNITPRLYVKIGCPWCQQAMGTLQQYQIPYDKIIVSNDAEAMAKMVELSGQSKAPTMDWDGEILADFGADELIPFLKAKGIEKPA